MIEVSLVPDIKRELLRARRIRNLIIFIVLIVTASAAGLVLILFTTFGIQNVTINNLNRNAESNHLALVQGRHHPSVNDILTLQAQLSHIDTINADKYLPSNIFGVLGIILPGGNSRVTVSELDFDRATHTIRFSGQSRSGYAGFNALVQTIARAAFAYVLPGAEPPDSPDGCRPLAIELMIMETSPHLSSAEIAQRAPVSDDVRQRCAAELLLDGDIQVGDSSYGQSADGSMVLRFEVAFSIRREVMSFHTSNLILVSPPRQNVTDSFNQIPGNMFEEAARGLEEGE